MNKWFNKYCWPITTEGYLITAIFLITFSYLFWIIARTSGSLSNTFMEAFPYLMPVGIIFYLIADKRR